MSEQLFNIKFVQEIQKHPCLYNNKMCEYSRKDITEKAWKSVGETVNLTVSECREKWKNLRTVFARHTKLSWSGKSKKKYYLADTMQFTLPFLKVSSGKLGIENTRNISETQVKVEEQYVELEDDTVTLHDPIQNCPSPEFTPLPYRTPPMSPDSESSHPSFSNCFNNPKRNDNMPPQIDHDIFNSRAKRKKVDDTNSREEANKNFLLSLLPDVNEMDKKQVRTFKKKTMEIIEEILNN